MEEQIVKELHKIEKQYNVKIVYACEAGSRSWGLGAANSDYDVRFIYLEQTSRYLSIDPIGIGKNKDVIELWPESNFDFSGWEMTKALRLFRNSNPSLLEWLNRGNVYLNQFQTLENLRALQSVVISQKTCLHHYLNIAEKNASKAKNKKIPVKLALAMIQPILIALTIKNYSVFPTGSFLSMTDNTTNGPIRSEIHMLVDEKMQAGGAQLTVVSDELIAWTEAMILSLRTYLNQLSEKRDDPTEELNNVFQDTLAKAWK